MAEPEPRDDPEYMKNFPNGFFDFDAADICFFEEDRDLNLEEEPTKINPEICDHVFARKPVKDSASCSANEKTYASSSRNREESSESGEIRRVDNKEDDRNDGDMPKTMDPQQQLTRTNPGSTSSTSDRNNISQPIVADHHNLYQHSMASQQNFYQLPLVNQIRGPALVDHNYEPWRLQNTYHQHPSANHMTNLMPGPMWPIQHPMAYPQNLYQHPMAD
ncbi:hypothetical protein ISN45_Aa06g037130, partial [Arabidopsis thaliana x Arabidopsis arenosa]